MAEPVSNPNLSLHALNRWHQRNIPLTQGFLEFIRRKAKEFEVTPQSFTYRNRYVVVGAIKNGEPTVVTVIDKRRVR